MLAIGQLLTWGCTIGLVVLLPRYLGAEALGMIATVGSLTGLCGLIAGLGVTTYLSRELGREGTGARAIVLNALALRIPLVLLACAAAALAANLLGYQAMTKQIIYISCIGIALNAISGVLSGSLEGLQQMRTLAIVGVVGKALTVVLAVVVVAADLGLAGLVVGGLIAGAVGVVWNLVAVIRQGALGGKIDVRTWQPIIAGSLPFFIWQGALMVYGQVDILLLSVLTSQVEVGWYAAALRIISIPIFVPAIVGGAIFPALAWTARRDSVEFGALARRALHVVLLLMIPMALGTMATAGRIISFLHFPAEFLNSVPLIVILAIHIPMSGASMVVGHVLNACDRQRWWAMTGVAAAVLNPAMGMLLIPHFEAGNANGAIGAAIGTVLTEVFMLSTGLWLARGLAFDRHSLGYVCRCLAAGGVMVMAVMLLDDTALPLTVIVGAVVYFGCSVVFGTLSLRDVRMTQSYLLNRAARATRA